MTCRFLKLLTRVEWERLSSLSCRSDPQYLPPPLSIHKLPSSIVSLLSRSLQEYPSYLFDGENYLFARPSLRQVMNVSVRPDSRALMSCSGNELPINYSTYDEYLCSKTLWGVGHSTRILCSNAYTFLDRPVARDLRTHTLSGSSLLLRSCPDHDNYWHWFFDCLPQLFFIAYFSASSIPSDLNVVLSSSREPRQFQIETLKHIISYLHKSPTMSLTVLNTSNDLVLRSLFIPISPSPLIHTQPFLTSYRAFLLQAFDVASLPTQCNLLYVRRGTTMNGRNLVNEIELEFALRTLGFSVIDCSDMSVCEQWSSFREASIVVGVHGSAFVNMMAMHPGATVVELVGSSYRPVHDFLLACQLKLNFREIEISIENQDSQFTSNYVCDPKEVVQALMPLLDPTPR